MIKKIKFGTIFILIGIAIPTVLAFFQKDGVILALFVKSEDKLREEEADLLNSISDLSKSLSPALELYKDEKAVTTAILEFAKIDFKIKSFLNHFVLYSKPHIGSESKNRPAFPDGKLNNLTPLTKDDVIELQKDSSKFIMGPSIYYWSLVNIPYKYSIGIGMLFFIFGAGVIILAIIGRKEKTA